jgi:hypothetical protein
VNYQPGQVALLVNHQLALVIECPNSDTINPCGRKKIPAKAEYGFGIASTGYGQNLRLSGGVAFETMNYSSTAYLAVGSVRAGWNENSSTHIFVGNDIGRNALGGDGHHH